MTNQYAIETTLKVLAKYTRHIVIISIAIIFAYAVFSGLFSNDATTGEVYEYSSEKQKLLSDIKNYENLTPDEQQAVDIKRNIACKLNGTFCNSEGLVTDQDFTKSYAFKLGQLIAYPLAQMPTSTSFVISQNLSNAGILPSVYAQTGIGYNSLLPFLNVWKQIRNITYVLVTILLIISAFFIMFRSNSDSRSSISLENYLPKIIVVMIFIEFSYAIAGFLIDLMYVLIMFVFLIFTPLVANRNYSFDKVLFDYMLGSPKVLFDLLVQSFGGIGNIFLHGSRDLLLIFGWPMGLLIGALIDGIIIQKLLSGLDTGWILKIATMIGKISGVGAVAALGIGFIAVLSGPLVVITVIMILALIYYTLKIVLTAVKAYIMIVMLVIFSPAIIFMELLPNSKYGISSWIRSLISNLIVFPVIYVAILLITVISATLRSAKSNPTGANLELPFMPTINTGFLFLIGIGMLSLLPKIIESIQNAIASALIPSPHDEIMRDKNAAVGLVTRGSQHAKTISAGAQGVRATPKIFLNALKKIKR